jgi:hypothetical protein
MTKERAAFQWRVVAEWKTLSSHRVAQQISVQQLLSLGVPPLSFVISTEAQRSGEISVWMLCLGNVFLPSEA